MKLCKDCKHSKYKPITFLWIPMFPKESWQYTCSHPELNEMSPVTGMPEKLPYCSIVRIRDIYCGPEARLYEPKSN